MSKLLSIGKSKDERTNEETDPVSTSNTKRSLEHVCEISFSLTVFGLVLGLLLKLLCSLPILGGNFYSRLSDRLVVYSLWVLVLTPTAGLVVALLQYVREQRWKFVSVITLLGIMLAMGVVIGGI